MTLVQYLGLIVTVIIVSLMTCIAYDAYYQRKAFNEIGEFEDDEDYDPPHLDMHPYRMFYDDGTPIMRYAPYGGPVEVVPRAIAEKIASGVVGEWGIRTNGRDAE